MLYGAVFLDTGSNSLIQFLLDWSTWKLLGIHTYISIYANLVLGLRYIDECLALLDLAFQRQGRWIILIVNEYYNISHNKTGKVAESEQEGCYSLQGSEGRELSSDIYLWADLGEEPFNFCLLLWTHTHTHTSVFLSSWCVQVILKTQVII